MKYIQLNIVLAITFCFLIFFSKQATAFDKYTNNSFNRFKKGDTTEIVKKKTKGLCSSFYLDTNYEEDPWDEYICTGYIYLNKRVSIGFRFDNNKLTIIRVKLGSLFSFYKNEITPRLVKKYGKPEIMTIKWYRFISFSRNKSVNVGIEEEKEINIVYKF